VLISIYHQYNPKNERSLTYKQADRGPAAISKKKLSTMPPQNPPVHYSAPQCTFISEQRHRLIGWLSRMVQFSIRRLKLPSNILLLYPITSLTTLPHRDHPNPPVGIETTDLHHHSGPDHDSPVFKVSQHIPSRAGCIAIAQELALHPPPTPEPKAQAEPDDAAHCRHCQSNVSFFLVCQWLHNLLIGCFGLSGFLGSGRIQFAGNIWKGNPILTTVMTDNLAHLFMREAEECSYLGLIGSGGYGEIHKVTFAFLSLIDPQVAQKLDFRGIHHHQTLVSTFALISLT
jgi:hypothetical protein